jgi:acyl dehydratase
MSEKKLFYEDVAEGDASPELSLLITKSHIVKYAGAGGDFNPIHYDEAFANALGVPSVFAMGLMQGGYMARALTEWVGIGNLRSYKIRFTGQVWPGETIVCKARAMRKYEENGEKRVECMLSVDNQAGENKITGTAVVALPTRE